MGAYFSFYTNALEIALKYDMILAGVNMSNKILETDRLILRPYLETDIDDYFEYMSQPEIGNILGFPPYRDKQTAKERLIKETTKNNFAILYKENNKVIGHVSIFNVKPERYKGIDIEEYSIEIGFLLSKSYWGKGIMPEALSSVVKYIFEQTQYQQIILGHRTINKQSERVQDKLGFKIIGEIVDEDNNPFIARKITKQDWLFKQAQDKNKGCV